MRLLGRVGQRAGDAVGLRRPASFERDAAAEEPPVGAVLVADPVLVLEDLCRAGEMRVERCLRSAMSSGCTRSNHASRIGADPAAAGGDPSSPATAPDT